jgi:hypothetical protein
MSDFMKLPKKERQRRVKRAAMITASLAYLPVGGLGMVIHAEAWACLLIGTFVWFWLMVFYACAVNPGQGRRSTGYDDSSWDDSYHNRHGWDNQDPCNPESFLSGGINDPHRWD